MPGVGDSLGRYMLLKKLAVGGMGEIFLAARPGPTGFAPPVVLKVLREEFASDPTFVDMLVDEANISKYLNHQNVVATLDFGEDKDTYFIALEFVQGITLKDLLGSLRQSRRTSDVPTALYIGTELCKALKYAHTRKNDRGEPLNIVHRDVTPGNVLLSIQGEVKLTDFGIARAKGRIHQTQAGVLKGKFGYMAPEMIRYEQIDARADIFCAGVVVYELIAGRHPVEGCAIMEAIQRFENRQIDPPSRANREASRELDQVIIKALDPKTDQRWDSAASFGNAMQDLALKQKNWRSDFAAGGRRLVALMRELHPAAFENPVSPEEMLHLYGRARMQGLVSSDPFDDTSEEAPSADLSSEEPSTAEEMEAYPAHKRSIPLSEVTDAHSHGRGGPAGGAFVDPAESRDSTVALSALAAEDDAVEMRFPDSSTDRSRQRPEMLEEQELPNGDATLSVPAVSRADDSKTVASGSHVPDWGAGIVVSSPHTEEAGFSEPDASYLPDAPPEPSYDDGATAFAGPRGEEPTMIPDDGGSAFGENAADRTLLDALTMEDIEAERRIKAVERRLGARSDEDTDLGEPAGEDQTSAYVYGAASGLDVAPQQLKGPLKITIAQDGAPSIASGDGRARGGTPIVGPAPVVGPAIGVGPAPSVGPAPGMHAHANVGAETGKWMRGETKGDGLDWDDDAAARRLLATRNLGGNTASAPVRGPGGPAGAALPNAPLHSLGRPPGPVGPQPVLLSSSTSSVVSPAPNRNALLLALAGVGMVVVIGLFLYLGKVGWPTVEVDTDPQGAYIVVDGRILTQARTPARVIVTPWRTHTLSVKLDGYPDESLPSVSLGLGGSHSARVSFQRPKVVLRISPQPGRVYVNDFEVGAGTNLTLSAIDPNSPVVIRVESPGFETWRMSFARGADVPSPLDVPLAKK